MRPIALDTNTYVGFKRGDERCLEVIRNAEHLLLAATVLGELPAGFACGEREARNREELKQFLDCRRVDIPAVGSELPGAWSRAVQPGCPLRAGGWSAPDPLLGGGSPLRFRAPWAEGGGAGQGKQFQVPAAPVRTAKG